MDERRRSVRKAFDTDVYCYVDGARMDARSSDISLGGTFVRTPDPDAVAIGAVVGLVFPRMEGGRHTTFVFGRVVRRQDEPHPGIGLEWEKAVTVGAPEQLARFLKRSLGLMDPPIFQEVFGPKAGRRSVFRFDSIPMAVYACAPAPVVAPAPIPEAAGGPGPVRVPAPARVPGNGDAAQDAGPEVWLESGIENLEAEFERMGVKVLRKGSQPVVSSFVSDGSTLPHSAMPGRITEMVERAVTQSATNLDATLEIDGSRWTGRILRLGLGGMFLQSPVTPIDRSAEVLVRFSIPSKNGSILVTCHCSLQGTRDARGPGPAGMDLEIRRVDEGTNAGVLERFVKWLQFNELAST